jgi:hypothetical protein
MPLQDKQLQQELLKQGITTEMPEEILPITVLKASELGNAYAYLGKDDKQSLSGRPLRDIGMDPLAACSLVHLVPLCSVCCRYSACRRFVFFRSLS